MLKNKSFFVFVVVLLTLSAIVSIRFALAEQNKMKWKGPVKEDGTEFAAPECPDPSIPGCNPPLNTGEAEQYKTGPLTIVGVLQGDSAAVFDNVRIGTSTGLGKLTILGGNMVLMKPETAHMPGYELILHSWSQTMTTTYSNEEELNNTQWQGARDNCLNPDKEKQFQCAPPQPNGDYCNDVYTKKDSQNNTIYYQALATCVGNASKYSLRANAGKLEFLNNADATQLTLTQEGDVNVAGSLTAQKFCLSDDCLTAWPTGAGTGQPGLTINQNGDVVLSPDELCLNGECRTGWPAAFVEADTLQTIANRGATTNKSLTVAGLSLDGGAAAEGDISGINALVGYNDIFIKGNSAETGEVFLTGGKVKIYTQNKERMLIDGEGRVGIGTAEPKNRLSIQGSIGLLRDSSSNVVAGPGPEIFLQSPSSEVTGVDTGWTACGRENQPQCGSDNTLAAENKDSNVYSCGSGDSGKVFTDIAQLQGADKSQKYQTTVSCLAGTSQYSLRTSDGALQFLNNKSDVKFALEQNGNITATDNITGQNFTGKKFTAEEFVASEKVVSGELIVQKLCLSGDCRAGWPQIIDTGGEQFVFTESDAVIGNEILDAANSTLSRFGAGTTADPYKLSLNLGNANIWTGSQTFNAETIFGAGITAQGIKAGNLNVADIAANALDVNNNVRIANSSKLVFLPGDFGKQEIGIWDYNSKQSDTCGSANVNTDGSVDSNGNPTIENDKDAVVCTGYNNVDECFDKAYTYETVGGVSSKEGYATREIKCVATAGNYALQNIGNSLVFKNGDDQTKFTIGLDGNAVFENQVTVKGGLCLNGECQTAWPAAADGVIGNEILDAANSTLSRFGAGTTADPYKLSLNLGNANIWTGSQTFNNKMKITGSGDDFLEFSRDSNIALFRLGIDGALVVNNQGDDLLTLKSGQLTVQGDILLPRPLGTGSASSYDLTFQGSGTEITAVSTFKKIVFSQPDSSEDNCDKKINTGFACEGAAVGLKCNDWAKVKGRNEWNYAEVECVANTSEYTVKLDNDGKLKFINNQDQTKLSVDQNGIIDIAGQIKIAGGSPGAGKVLMSNDANGLASWQSLPSAPSLSSSEWQKRVVKSCGAGSSIREITEVGTVVCESDDVGFTSWGTWTEYSVEASSDVSFFGSTGGIYENSSVVYNVKVCFLTKVLVHDDDHDSRQQGCWIAMSGNTATLWARLMGNASIGKDTTICGMVCLK